mgnify:CR=1 FL=1
MDGIEPEELVHPFPLFRLCMLDMEKARLLADKLKNEFLYLPDELRNDASIWEIMYRNFGWDENGPLCLPYEIGNFDGALVFKDIVKNDGCILRLMFWGKHLWGLDGVKQARKLIKLVMDTFGLKVIYAGTADPKIVKMAKFVGFKLKSTRQDGFRWNGVSYPSYQLEINGG